MWYSAHARSHTTVNLVPTKTRVRVFDITRSLSDTLESIAKQRGDSVPAPHASTRRGQAPASRSAPSNPRPPCAFPGGMSSSTPTQVISTTRREDGISGIPPSSTPTPRTFSFNHVGRTSVFRQQEGKKVNKLRCAAARGRRATMNVNTTCFYLKKKIGRESFGSERATTCDTTMKASPVLTFLFQPQIDDRSVD